MKITASIHLSDKQKVNIAILVAALGYFVDVYDIILFSVVRVASLSELGVTGDKLLSNGVMLLNVQMIGMLIGGLVWGVLGDKLGRIQVLFGSILLYSLANILNGLVGSVEQYAVLRFIAGFGLAGEIGAGITLVSELMSKESRGYGTTLVATVGVSGGVLAALVGDLFHWRTAYFVGGGMGLALLLLRVSVSESGMFDSAKKDAHIARGDLALLFGSFARFKRYIYCILTAVPLWFVVGIIVTFCPEIGSAIGSSEPLKASTAVLACYFGMTIGDLASGLISQFLKSRKKTIAGFVAMIFVLTMVLLNSHGLDPIVFYVLVGLIGFFTGYWAVFVTTSAEQFGTNLRATVTTSAPNFVRGTVVPITLFFNFLKPSIGVLNSAKVLCIITCALALYSLYRLPETFGRDLDFIEKNDKKT